MKNLFVNGLMAAAAVVTLAACSNDEEVVAEAPAGDATVTLGVSVSVPGTKAATTADQVNQDADFAEITNIRVVPMKGNTTTTPLVLDNITAAAANKTSWKPYKISQDVNAFRVYAGVPDDVMNTITPNLESFSYSAPEDKDNGHTNLTTWMAEEENMPGISLIGQYPLMYFGNTAINGGYYACTSETDWDQLTTEWGEKTTGLVGTNNRIKIDGVQYGVGVLASGVSYRRAKENMEEETACFGDTEAETKYSELTLGDGQGMILKAILIADQPTAIDADLQGTDHNGLLFAAATDATLKTEKLAFDSNNRIGTANIYAVVMPETSNSLDVWFQFQNNTGKSLFNEAGDLIAENGGYAYYKGTLSTQTQNQDGSKLIFDADYTTLLNGNIINWSNGTPYPQPSTQVQVGVEIDVDWQKGLEYDLEF